MICFLWNDMISIDKLLIRLENLNKEQKSIGKIKDS
jgi:hypothetical protein